jgi:predicted RNA-binding Zn-ribbon protein involved in translation (DUF1610 family)
MLEDATFCSNCEAEFEVSSAFSDPVEWCPFCGEKIIEEEDYYHNNYEDE